MLALDPRPLVAVIAFLLCSKVRGQNGDTAVPTPAPTLQPVTAEPTVPNSTNGTLEPTPSPVIPTMEPTWQKLDCYDNITVLQLHLNQKDPLLAETFTLCPNTTFEIGYDCYGGGKYCRDGQSPLLPRSNSRINCGDDGKAENNCIVMGGKIQMMFDYFAYFEQSENAEVNGVTFANSEYSSVVLFNGGDIRFRNCVFMVRLCTAPWEPSRRCPDFSYTSLSLLAILSEPFQTCSNYFRVDFFR
jgi:hypothetical protein